MVSKGKVKNPDYAFKDLKTAVLYLMAFRL